MPPADRRIVLVAGTPGTDTDVAVRQIVDYADATGQRGKWIKCDKFEKVLLEAHNEANPGDHLVDIIPLLERPKAALRHLWRSAGKRLCSKLSEVGPERNVLLVPIHLVWFNHHVRDYINVIDAELVRCIAEVGIHHVLCLIDDVNDVYSRLAEAKRLYDPRLFPLTPQEEQEGFVLIRFLELLEWRRREIAEAEALADHLATPFTLLATKHQKSVGYRCVNGEPQAYLSHPITELRRLERSRHKDNVALNQEVREWLWEFQQALSRHVPLLQPTCIDEYRRDEMDTGIGFGPRFYDPKRYVDGLVKPAVQADREVFAPSNDETSPQIARAFSRLVESQVRYQVTSRDLQLVAQAPYLILFRPHFNGDLPGGVWEEIAEFVKIGPYSKYKDRRIFVLESETDRSRIPPRQFLERLVKATRRRRWSGELHRDHVCDYLAQLSSETCDQITQAARTENSDMAGEALANLLRDLEMPKAWELLKEDTGPQKPLSDAENFPRRVADIGEFLTSLLDTGAASEVLLAKDLTTRIAIDGKRPDELADELVKQIRTAPSLVGKGKA